MSCVCLSTSKPLADKVVAAVVVAKKPAAKMLNHNPRYEHLSCCKMDLNQTLDTTSKRGLS